MNIDHIVISVKDFKRSIKFYSAFLGKAVVSKYDAHWKLGEIKLFLTYPYKKSAISFDKSNLGLNHIAFRATSKRQLLNLAAKLRKAGIPNSGIVIDQYSKKDFIWFDDPDGIRLEFYLR